jgi:hypothetical protein
MMPSIDTQVHLSDLIVGVGGIIAFLKVFLSDRDLKRDLVSAVGDLKKDVGQLQTGQNAHHEWLIRAGLDHPVIDRRAHPRFPATIDD